MNPAAVVVHNRSKTNGRCVDGHSVGWACELSVVQLDFKITIWINQIVFLHLDCERLCFGILAIIEGQARWPYYGKVLVELCC